MSRRKGPIDPERIKEIEDLRNDGYSVEIPINKNDEPLQGTWLFEGWLFIFPRNCKYGERYRQIYGHYKPGHLKEFVELAAQNKFDKRDIFYGASHLYNDELVQS